MILNFSNKVTEMRLNRVSNPDYTEGDLADIRTCKCIRPANNMNTPIVQTLKLLE